MADRCCQTGDRRRCGCSAGGSPLTGAQLVIGTIALSLATFMNVLDTSIANVSFPAIAGDLGVSPTRAPGSSPPLRVANAIALPLTGWLSRASARCACLSPRSLCSWWPRCCAALAPTLSTLILFRVMQGAVAGPMIPLSQTLLLSSYPPAIAPAPRSRCGQ